MKMIERHYGALMKHIPAGQDVPAIEISSAAKWFLEESEKEHWDFTEDFPAVVPPYPITWLEYAPPRSINSNGHRNEIDRRLNAMGCMAVSIQIKDGQGQEVIRQDALRKFVRGAAHSAGRGIESARGDAESDQRIADALQAGYSAKWIVIFKLYFEAKKEIRDLYTLVTYLDADGKIVPGLHNFVFDKWLADRMGEEVNHIGAETFPFLFALSLMHAKNVTLEDAPLAAPAIAKKRERQGKHTIRFKTLVVHPMRQAAKAQASEGKTSAKHAMHLCRGHFKDFRDSKGLFGKYKGLYWWDMHVRGDRAHGQVVKDYAVMSPFGSDLD